MSGAYKCERCLVTYHVVKDPPPEREGPYLSGPRVRYRCEVPGCKQGFYEKNLQKPHRIRLYVLAADVPARRANGKDKPELTYIPTMRGVLDAVSQVTGVKTKDLMGPRRGQAARPRQLGMYLMHELCPIKSFPQIGNFMHRDHTTVMYACRRIESLLEQDAELVELRGKVMEVLERG